MQLLLNAASVKPPFAGISNYTLYLLNALVKNSYLNEIYCFNGKKWVEGNYYLAAVNDSNNNLINNYKSEINQAIINKFNKLCYSYQIRDCLLKTRLKKKVPGEHKAIFHEPSFVLRSDDRPSVVTIHDLSYLMYPDYHPECRVKWLNKKIPETIRKANRIITISNVVRDQLLDIYNLSPEQVATIPLGVDKRYKPRSREASCDVLKQFGLSYKQYILFVGTIEPRKGIDLLLDSWLMLPKLYRSNFELVLIGGDGWLSKELIERIRKLQSEGQIKYLKYINQEYLPFLYSAAKLFVFPSFYEGFGLPALEAMASGAPVICNRHTSMYEFSSGAAVFYESSDEEELSHTIKQVLDDQSLLDNCTVEGLKISARYTWELCAEKTIDVYRSIDN